MRALPSLRIAVCKRRDQVYGIASTHTLPAELDILLDDAAHRSERRQKPQALFDEACHEWGIPTQLRLQLLIPTQCVQKASQERLRLIVQATQGSSGKSAQRFDQRTLAERSGHIPRLERERRSEHVLG